MPELHKFDNIASNWENKAKGLQKHVIELNFESMVKPTDLSKCYIRIETNCTDKNSVESNYITISNKFWLQLGVAVTPIDMYIELFLLQMFEGEKSECCIKTKSSKELKLIITLHQVELCKYYYQLNLLETYNLAKQFKENGVVLFKKYPKFAHAYFCRSAKLLISYKPFNSIPEIPNEISITELDLLLQNVQTNIAACLIKLGSFDDVIFLTEFIEQTEEKSEKAIYRRAFAYFKLKQFTEARKLIERNNLSKNKDFWALYANVLNGLKDENDIYKNVVKKMFRL